MSLIVDSRLLEQVYRIAVAAGEAIMAVYQQPIAVEHKADQSPLTAADRAAHQLIAAALAALTPQVPLLSEEGAEVPWAERSQWQQFWLVDPLDGTKEFIKRNGEFTVNIALIGADGAPVLGVVYAPALQLGFAGLVAERQAWCDSNGQRRAIASRTPELPWQVVGSRSHASAEVVDFCQRLPAHQLVAMGSSLKLCLVADGRADLYPRLGPTMAWDTAAAHAVLAAAGGEVVAADSRQPLRYNPQPSLLNPHFLAASTAVLAALA